ncbi:UNVERIFIED_CONTAM: Retrovirus-related Pol polyprotein from transposon TNT 1-94 [Sesamum latifolium]|uniref:Retrovirus-related Pol polyprotein from transposon TNT 1-94 n=1 Tax=Sesamum latifolium TaxID=2727402 RepID=A0AAW2WP15_9LAMI
MVENQSGFRIKALRSDRGGEFTSNEFKIFCEQNGIHRPMTTPYSPQQNGVAERKNRTILNMARSMLKCKNMPKEYWAEAISCAVYLMKSYTKSVHEKTPQEAWSGYKPVVTHLRVFGSIAYTHISHQKRTKLDDKSARYVFIGYDQNSKGYKLYNPSNGKIEISRDVEFDEEGVWEWNDQNKNDHYSPFFDDEEEDMVQPITPPSTPPPQNIQADEASSKTEPVDFNDAARDEKWRNAMDEEIKAIENNDSWELESLPKGKNTIGVRWVYKIKRNAKGEIENTKQDWALYGLKQAPRAWNSRIDHYFQNKGFIKCPHEHALYVKKNTKVKQRDDGIFISQEGYAKEILKKFEMENCMPVSTPVECGVKLSSRQDGKKINSTYFKSLVGSLRYLTCTRPDILFGVGLVSRHMEAPTTSHLKVAKRILRYIQGTIDHGIFYKSSQDFELVGYCDSDWAGLLKELNFQQKNPTEIFVDNKSAIALAKNRYFMKGASILIRSIILFETAFKKEVKLEYVKSQDQIADIFTKALKFDSFKKLRFSLGVMNLV